MEWNKETIEEIVNFINLKLKSGRTMKDIELEDFNVNERVIDKRLKRIGYKKIDNQYIKDVGKCVGHRSGLDVRRVKIESSDEIGVKNNTSVKKGSKFNWAKKYPGLFSKYEVIMAMIEAYENATMVEVTKRKIKIDLPDEEKTDARASFRINDTVYKDFKKFAEKNNQYTVKDMVSQSLIDFMDKYK